MKYTYKLYDNTVIWLEKLISNNKDLFDEEVFREWYWNRNIEFKSNPDNYLKSMFEKELLSGTFKHKEIIPNCTPLFNDMREKLVEVFEEDTLYISIMEYHLLNKQGVSKNELIDLNHKAVDYIISKNERPTTKDFIAVFKKSKRHFNFKEIEKEYERKSKEYL